MAEAVKEVIADVKASLAPPKKATGWIALLIVLFLLAIVFVAVERRKPGFFSRLVNPVRRIPGANRVVTLLVWAAAAGAFGWLASAHGAQLAHGDSFDPTVPLPLIIGLGLVRRNGVEIAYTPLSSPGSGVTYSLLASNGNRKVTWVVDKLPTRDRGLHWHVPYLEVTAYVPITQTTATTNTTINPDKLHKILRAFELRSQNKLGTLWSQGDTSGARLGLIDSRIAAGYEPPVLSAVVIGSSGATYYTQVKWIIPFAQGCSDKPHHFSPHGALLNDAVLDLFFDTSTVLDGDSDGCTVGDMVISVMALSEGEPEARLHTPAKWGIYQPQGLGTKIRLKLLQLGDKGGLNGVHDGMGLAALYLMADPTTDGTDGSEPTTAVSGLGGGFQGSEIVNVQADFLGLPSLEFPEALVNEFIRTVGNAPGPVALASGMFDFPQYTQFPYLYTADRITFAPGIYSNNSASGSPLTSNLLFYPFRMPGRNFELSKIPEVKGTGELIVTFDSNKSEKTFQVGTLEFGSWTEDFKAEAMQMIFGNEAGKYAWVHKYSKKQRPDDAGNIHVDDHKHNWLPYVAVPVK